VSKPVKSRSDTVLDFSTYINMLTIRAELTAFQARNGLGSATLTSPDNGVLGIAKDTLDFETVGKDVSFGYVSPATR
jgi:hypothetical protein